MRASPHAKKIVPEDFLEEELVRLGVQDRVKVERSRGEAFSKGEGKDGPYQRLDCISHLHAFKRINLAQQQAGEKYGNHYRLLYDVGRLPSSLEWGVSNSGSLIPDVVKRYGDELHGARVEGLGGNETLIRVCDKACGKGEHIPVGGALYGHLKVALDRLTDFYAGRWLPMDNDFSGLTKGEWYTIAETVNGNLTWEEFDEIWHASGMGDGAEARADRRALQAWSVKLYGSENSWGVGGSGSPALSGRRVDPVSLRPVVPTSGFVPVPQRQQHGASRHRGGNRRPLHT